MRKRIAVMFAAALAAVAPSFADDKDKVTDRSRPERTYRDSGDADVTYGRIKELNAGRKVVIDVDNAIDKSFDLTDNDESVNMAADLKVGDPVKVTEHKVNGKKTVQIIHHAGGGVRHGDQDTAARADRVETDSDVTYGRIKEFAGGRIVIDVDNAVDKTFEVADNDRRVNVAGGLKLGDPVKVTEREVNGKKTVQIVKHTAGNVQHGDPDRKK